MSFEGVYCFFSGIFYNDLNIDSISHPFNHLSVIYKAFICFIYNAFFFVLEKLFHCRSPPFYQFETKKQIDRRNNKWTKVLKEENTRIIHIL